MCTSSRSRLQSEYLHYCDRVVVEHGRDILAGEFVGRVADEQTCLANRTIANNNAPSNPTLAIYTRLRSCVHLSQEMLIQHVIRLQILRHKVSGCSIRATVWM